MNRHFGETHRDQPAFWYYQVFMHRCKLNECLVIYRQVICDLPTSEIRCIASYVAPHHHLSIILIIFLSFLKIFTFIRLLNH